KNEVLGFLKKPLKDLCISRPVSRLSWGIPLPFDKEYVTYVWFDALLNYYSAVKDDDRWPASLHLIGKDILTTHSVYWPIMLKAAGLEMPKTIFAHGWWLIDQTKMSKSLGNVVQPMEMADIYGVDAFRYFLMREMTPGHDSSFSEESLIKRINDDLANDLGNLLSRVTTLIYKFFDGKIPDYTGNNEEWLKLSHGVVDEIKQNIENLRIDEVVQAAMKPVKYANRYLEENAPWKLAKTDREKAGNVLYNALEALRFSAVALAPVMPKKSAEILTRLQAENTELTWGQLQPGKQIQKGASLFPRVEKKIETDKKIDEKHDSLNLITIDDFKKVKLCVGQIKSAEAVEGADKLLKLKIDIGKEMRQLVAGIAMHYTCESLIDKKIIVITNLQKAVIRGVESQGMLLAAGKGKKMTLLTVDQDIPVGATIS
ncbi:MAG: methionine--tRNA ligase subunit beta, partial [FCB group bacterium]|nr:methionine--tRNA ligase subunit beta [FCB group bacterium]